jgi:hypothetical protein
MANCRCLAIEDTISRRISEAFVDGVEDGTRLGLGSHMKWINNLKDCITIS